MEFGYFPKTYDKRLSKHSKFTDLIVFMNQIEWSLLSLSLKSLRLEISRKFSESSIINLIYISIYSI